MFLVNLLFILRFGCELQYFENKYIYIIFNKDISLKTFFVVTKDINHTIILDTPFIDMITPYQAYHNCITSKINSIKLIYICF